MRNAAGGATSAMGTETFLIFGPFPEGSVLESIDLVGSTSALGVTSILIGAFSFEAEPAASIAGFSAGAPLMKHNAATPNAPAGSVNACPAIQNSTLRIDLDLVMGDSRRYVGIVGALAGNAVTVWASCRVVEPTGAASTLKFQGKKVIEGAKGGKGFSITPVDAGMHSPANYPDLNVPLVDL